MNIEFPSPSFSNLTSSLTLLGFQTLEGLAKRKRWILNPRKVVNWTTHGLQNHARLEPLPSEGL